MENINFVVSRGEASDIDTIVQFQADMAMESEGFIPSIKKK